MTTPVQPILPPATLGMLGGGQLGRMFTLAARRMGYRVVVLDPDANSPAAQVADAVIAGAYDDPAALAQLAAQCAAVSTEFENVPAPSLAWLAERLPVAPGASAVAIAQDRVQEKNFFHQAGLTTAPFAVIETPADLEQSFDDFLPGILKTARLGYDGKGQIRVSSAAEVVSAWQQLGSVACVLEKRLALVSEVSVIVARSFAGHSAVFPVSENHHADGILDVSIVPARVPDTLAVKAQQMAIQLADALDYVGVMALELFVLDNGDLVANEMAPRPHNSGHYSIDACAFSQYEQQVLTLCGFAPASTTLHSPVVMVNILGDSWANGSPRWEVLLGHPRTKLHLYGKNEARPGRKMAHFCVLDDCIDHALAQARELQSSLVAQP
jgi:5-(carboxyamino)imidazole ribonucleotide synthase